jgi:hypothetical protein
MMISSDEEYIINIVKNWKIECIISFISNAMQMNTSHIE